MTDPTQPSDPADWQPPPQGPPGFQSTPAPPNLQSQAMSSQPVQANAVMVQAKNPGVAAVLSAVWTGAGQIYNGQIGLGLAFMAIQFINFLLIFLLIGFLTVPIMWIIGIVQAYSSAKSFNARHGIIS